MRDGTFPHELRFPLFNPQGQKLEDSLELIIPARSFGSPISRMGYYNHEDISLQDMQYQRKPAYSKETFKGIS